MKCRIPDHDVVDYETFRAAIMATDLCYLMAAREIFGAGEVRLRKLVGRALEIYDEYKTRYATDEDVRRLTCNAPHLLAMADELATSGFIYERELRMLNTHKYRWRGNKVLLKGEKTE